MLNEVEGIGLDFLPGRSSRLESAREQAFYQFVRAPTDSQRSLLASLLDTSYFLTILSLDPKASELIREIARGQVIYLDTNVIYRILNLNTPRQFLSMQRLLELTRELGYRLGVTPWTITELRTSLERARDYLKSKPVPPGELAAIAAAATTDENFITAYWRRIRAKPVSVDDFYDFYNEIESHLEKYDIHVITDGVKVIESNREAIDEELSAIARVPGPRMKSQAVMEHDVMHRLLVRRLRGEGHRRFANAGWWFLTLDSSLPRYDSLAREGEAELPFCITNGVWLQITRAFTPRTADFDQTLTDLMASPYVRYRGRIAYDTVREVVNRVELFKGATPDLAASVLFNTALLREIGGTQDAERRATLIDNAIVEAAADLEKQLAAAQAEADAEREGRKLERDRVEALQDAVVRERAERIRLEQRLELERTAREESSIEAQADAEEDRASKGYAIKQLEADLQKARDDFSSFKQNALKWAKWSAGALIIALTAAVLAVIALANKLDSPMNVALASGLLCIGLGIGLAAFLGWKRVGFAAGFIGVVVTIMAVVYQFADDGTPNPPPDDKTTTTSG